MSIWAQMLSLAEVQPRYSRDTAEVQPRYSRGDSRGDSRCAGQALMLTALAFFYLHHTGYWSTPLLLTALLYGLQRTVTLPSRSTLAHWHACTLGQRTPRSLLSHAGKRTVAPCRRETTARREWPGRS